MVYTGDEVDYLKGRGFGGKTVVSINNGLDQRSIDNTCRLWTAARLSEWQHEEHLEDKVVLLSVARLKNKNRFELVIEALPRLVKERTDLVWVVIGDGELRESLEAKVKALGLENNVRWLGAVYDESQLAPWFLSAQVLIHPGSIGLTLLHAYGYGLPVVTHGNREHQMPEIAAFFEGETGLSFPEGNVEQLHIAVEKLLSDKALRSKMQKNVIEIARTQYNVQVMADRFASVIGAAAHGEQVSD